MYSIYYYCFCWVLKWSFADEKRLEMSLFSHVAFGSRIQQISILLSSLPWLILSFFSPQAQLSIIITPWFCFLSLSNFFIMNLMDLWEETFKLHNTVKIQYKIIFKVGRNLDYYFIVILSFYEQLIMHYLNGTTTPYASLFFPQLLSPTRERKAWKKKEKKKEGNNCGLWLFVIHKKYGYCKCYTVWANRRYIYIYIYIVLYEIK